jgi:pimeloyl-ACP methyl ester carboxylesterase
MKNQMKLFLALSVTVLCSIQAMAQSKIIGDWEGLLNIGSKKIKIIIHVKSEANVLKTFMDSPDQGAINIPIEQTVITNDSMIISDAKKGITIKGNYKQENDSISANFIQGGGNIPIAFGRSSVKGFVLNRPQTPKPPFPYLVEDVVFVNRTANNIKLAGTITIPKDIKKPCVAILISGSGPQNRNEKAFDHEPFLVLSDYLSRNGIAVLRFDDRGTAQSEGDFKSATSYDLSTDVEAAFEYLLTRNDIDKEKIGLIGHSEGGLIAPLLAARNDKIAFVISLAGPAVEIDKLMLKQIEDLAVSESNTTEQIKSRLDLNSEVFTAIKSIDEVTQLEIKTREILTKNSFANNDKKSHDNFIKRITSPWFRYFIRYNPRVALEKIHCPVLAINGNLDKQVNAEMNLEAMRTALTKANNPDFTIQYLPGLNHGFQEAKTGNVAEYTMIEQTMSPLVLETVAKWIRKRF